MLAIAIGNTGMQSVLPAIGRTLRIPDQIIATAFSFSALIWALAAPIWARLLERRGAKAMVLLGLCGFTVSLLTCALALTAGILDWIAAGLAFAGFIIGRAIYGTFGAAAPPAAQALVAAATSRAERTQALTLLASAFGLGTILGPALAPFFVLPVVGLAGPAYMFALMGIAMMLLVAAKLPGIAPGAGHGAPVADPEVGGLPGDASVIAGTARSGDAPVRFTDRRIWPWMIFGLVSGHAQAIAGQTMAFLIIDRLAIAPTAAQPLIGVVLMSGAGAALLAQWGVIPRLDPSPRQMVLWGAILAAIGCAAITIAHGLHELAVAYGLASLGFGFLRPGFTAGASLAVAEHEQAAAAGRVTANNGYAFVLGPSAGIAMYGVWHPLPYLIAAIGLLLLLPYGARVLTPDRQPKDAR